MSATTAPIAWNNRLFDRLGCSPVWVGLGMALSLIVLLLAVVQWSGELGAFVAGDTRWWEDRNARVALMLVLLAAYLPTARRYEWLGATRDFEELLRGGFSSDTSTPAWSSRRATAAGLLGLFVVPFTALLVDRDPGLYLRDGYWVASNLFIWLIGGVAAWNAGILFATVWSHATHLSRLARKLPALRLLHLEELAPFSRYGLRCALLWSLIPGIWAFNLVDRGFVAAVGSTAALAAVGATLALLLPLRGVRDRVRADKRAELARIDAALEGNLESLRSSALQHWSGSLGVADLLAYRSRIEDVREWPLDPPTFARFGLYLLIPIGSWLGGAFVERIVDALFD